MRLAKDDLSQSPNGCGNESCRQCIAKPSCHNLAAVGIKNILIEIIFFSKVYSALPQGLPFLLPISMCDATIGLEQLAGLPFEDNRLAGRLSSEVDGDLAELLQGR